MGQNVRIKNDAYVSSSSPCGGTGGEVFRLRLHLVFMCFVHFPDGSAASGRTQVKMVCSNRCECILTKFWEELGRVGLINKQAHILIDFLGAMDAVAPIQIGLVGAAHRGNQAQVNSIFYKVTSPYCLWVIENNCRITQHCITFLKCLKVGTLECK